MCQDHFIPNPCFGVSRISGGRFFVCRGIRAAGTNKKRISGGRGDYIVNWDAIREEFETTAISLTALAEKYDIKIGTLKSRKSREKWEKRKAAAKKKKAATKRQKVATSGGTKEAKELNGKQELFCIYYIKYFNATKAYLKAYDCAYTTAAVEGHRSLKNPKIIAKIDELKAEQFQEVKLSARDVLQKYIDIAFADITDFVEFGTKKKVTKEIIGYDADDEPIHITTEDDESYFRLKNDDRIDGTIVTEIKEGTTGVSVKLADRMKALEKLEQYTDLLNDRELQLLRIAKTKAETEKIQAETKNEETGSRSVYVVADKNAMREAMEARAAAKRQEAAE